MKILKPLAQILCAFMIGNGLFMVVLSHLWYETIPGVEASGSFNAHFVVDIGLIYLTCGAFFLIGAARKVPLLILAGSIWPFLHAVFHLFEWLVHGIPGTSAFVAEGVGVVFLAFAGLACAVVAVRRPEVLT